jgi:hypothetical protein
LEDETTSVDDAAGQAAFGAGFDDKPAEKSPERTDKPDPATIARETDPAPEYVQITKNELAEIKAAAAKTASYDKQLASAFGTIGNLKQAIDKLQSKGQQQSDAPTISSAAFTKLQEQFPELADMTKEAVQNALVGFKSTGDAEADEAKFAERLAKHTSAREIEALEDAHPDWRNVVGAVDTGEQPDPEHPFRKWLGTKPPEYQARVSGTQSALVLSRAINLFQRETKAPAKTQPPARDNARADVIRAAVQPRGDGGAPTSSNTREDAFAAGFGS